MKNKMKLFIETLKNNKKRSIFTVIGVICVITMILVTCFAFAGCSKKTAVDNTPVNSEQVSSDAGNNNSEPSNEVNKDETTSSEKEDASTPTSSKENDKTSSKPTSEKDPDKNTSKDESSSSDSSSSKPSEDNNSSGNTSSKEEDKPSSKPVVVQRANPETGISWDGKSPIIYTYSDGSTGTEKRNGATYEYLPGMYTKVVIIEKEEYDPKCSHCGKISGDGTDGTCLRYSLINSDMTCPNCGENIPKRTCHTCK